MTIDHAIYVPTCDHDWTMADDEYRISWVQDAWKTPLGDLERYVREEWLGLHPSKVGPAVARWVLLTPDFDAATAEDPALCFEALEGALCTVCRADAHYLVGGDRRCQLHLPVAAAKSLAIPTKRLVVDGWSWSGRLG